MRMASVAVGVIRGHVGPRLAQFRASLFEGRRPTVGTGLDRFRPLDAYGAPQRSR
jgi:hypothetical protein